MRRAAALAGLVALSFPGAAGADVSRDCALCPTLVAIPSRPDAAPMIAVSVTPVTFAQWDACVDDGGCGGYRPDRQGWPADAPVVNVSYADAERYSAWLRAETGARYRLIREREWAWLATIGHRRAYPWGDAVGRANTNCLECGSAWDGKGASPVRSFAADPHGLYDLVGNVAHWTEPDPAPQAMPPRCAKSGERYAAIFGASWADPAKYLSPGEWACFPKILRDDTIGFRVVKELSPGREPGPRARRYWPDRRR